MTMKKQRYNVVPFAERRWHLAELEARREAIVADPARAAELRGVDFRLNGARSCLELEGWPELTHEDLVKAIAQLRNQVAELRARNSELDAALDEFLLED